MNTTLPNALEVSGISYAIRTDYRCALDALAALNDVELDEREKALFVLCVLYEDPFAAAASDIREALERGVWYLNGGEESGGESRKEPRLMDWEQDFPLIVPPGEPACWDGDVRAPGAVALVDVPVGVQRDRGLPVRAGGADTRQAGAE